MGNRWWRLLKECQGNDPFYQCDERALENLSRRLNSLIYFYYSEKHLHLTHLCWSSFSASIHCWDWICTHHFLTQPSSFTTWGNTPFPSLSWNLLHASLWPSPSTFTYSRVFTEAPFCPKLYTSLWGFHSKQSWPSWNLKANSQASPNNEAEGLWRQSLWVINGKAQWSSSDSLGRPEWCGGQGGQRKHGHLRLKDSKH